MRISVIEPSKIMIIDNNDVLMHEIAQGPNNKPVLVLVMKDPLNSKIMIAERDDVDGCMKESDDIHKASLMESREGKNVYVSVQFQLKKEEPKKEDKKTKQEPPKGE